jgi:PhzF family phenazine biosynthesis protein
MNDKRDKVESSEQSGNAFSLLYIWTIFMVLTGFYLMKIPIYQVDAFTDEIFKGNPAAVCPLEEWLSDTRMHSIAMENQLSETAFFVPENDGFHIRWFTPVSEVDLCGHATLAAAHVLFHHLKFMGDTIRFQSKSGNLVVSKGKDGLLKMDFPSFHPIKIDNDPFFGKVFGKQPLSAFSGNYLMLVYQHEQDIRAIRPDFALLKTREEMGTIITSPGKDFDFISRFFAPSLGIDEDPVTGSAHSMMIPFWAAELQKASLTAYQCSYRGGILFCEYAGDRVIIGGKAITYLQGIIHT